MSDTKGTKIWQWAVLLLVLCNVALVAMIWLKPHPGRPAGPGGDGPRNEVIERLKLTDDQVKKYDVMIKDHQSKMQELNKASRELKKQLFSNVDEKGGTPKTADSLSAAIGTVQKDIELVTYNHFAQLKGICTEQQKQEFDKIIMEVTRNMNNGRRGPRPGPDGPPPGRDGDAPPPPDGR